MSKRDIKAANSAINNARSLHRKGMHKQAEEVYRMILLQDAGNTSALLELGIALAQRGETEEPRELYSKVLALEPRNGDAMMALAIVTLEAGDRAEALRLAAQARQLKPSSQTLGKLGVFYSKTGLKDEALECLKAAVRRDPADVTSYFSLQRLKQLKPGTPEFSSLLALERKAAGLSPADRATLHYTLGNAFLDADEPAKAFPHFAEANRLKKSSAYFNMEQYTRQIDDMIRQFDDALVKKLSGKGGSPSERPVFIVGLPRSGSTLVDQIIASHPDARGMGEVRFFQDGIPEFIQRDPGAISPETLAPEVLSGIANKYLAVTERHAAGAQRLADKMLMNFFWIGIIRLALPNAKIIHCTRDLADTAFSIWQLMFSEGLVPWGYDARDIGCYFKGYRKIMAHWNRLFPGRIYEANYESMVAGQEKETRKLVEFCGLPWDDRCLKFYETERTVKTASAGQVRRPIYADSAGKWKKYEAHLGFLLDEIRE